jgi:hypothetical protein
MIKTEQVLKEGLRFNEGKSKWGLLSWPALRELVAVLEFGARKYASWNWSKGLSWSECFESLQRHLISWYQGEDKDPETGLSHIAHVMCNAMFLMHFIIFRTGRDDRPGALNQGDKSIGSDHKEDGAKPAPIVLYAERGDYYTMEPGRVPYVQADLFPAEGGREHGD